MRYFFVVLFLFACTTAFGQMYEVKYSFNKLDSNLKVTDSLDNTYQALLFYNPDNDTNSNVMRVRFYDKFTKSWLIVEQKIIGVKIEQDGKKYYGLVGRSPKFISTVPSSYRYDWDMIVFQKDSGDSLYRPSFVATRDIPKSDSLHIGKFISFTPLVQKDVTNDYLLLYNWKWPDTLGTGNFDFSQSNLWVILASNTKNDELGTGFRKNNEKIKGLFHAAAKACNMKKFIPVEIIDSNFNKAFIKKVIDTFSPGPNDIVVFYYSGHGFRYVSQKDSWPMMELFNPDPFPTQDELNQLRTNCSMNLNRDVYTPLLNKKPRFLLVVGECCNNLTTTPDPTVDIMPIKLAGAETGFQPAAMKQLLKQKGTILVATAKPNEFSVYNLQQGGFFCDYFCSNLSSLNTIKNATISWNDILKTAAQQTREAALNSPKQNVHGKIEALNQEPMYGINVSE